MDPFLEILKNRTQNYRITSIAIPKSYHTFFVFGLKSKSKSFRNEHKCLGFGIYFSCYAFTLDWLFGLVRSEF